MTKDKEDNEIAAANQGSPSKGFNPKHRRPVYKIAIIVVVVLMAIYLVSVYKNRHEAKATPTPANNTENPYKKDAGGGK